MTGQPKSLATAPTSTNWDRNVQELMSLLVEAVLGLPEGEKRRVLDSAITPLFEALLTLNEAKEVSGGYQDYARRLWPPKTTSIEGTASAECSSSAMKDTPDAA